MRSKFILRSSGVRGNFLKNFIPLLLDLHYDSIISKHLDSMHMVYTMYVQTLRIFLQIIFRELIKFINTS